MQESRGIIVVANRRPRLEFDLALDALGRVLTSSMGDYSLQRPSCTHLK